MLHGVKQAGSEKIQDGVQGVKRRHDGQLVRDGCDGPVGEHSAYDVHRLGGTHDSEGGVQSELDADGDA